MLALLCFEPRKLCIPSNDFLELSLANGQSVRKVAAILVKLIEGKIFLGGSVKQCCRFYLLVEKLADCLNVFRACDKFGVMEGFFALLVLF